MQQLVKLPSGLVVNLTQVSRVMPAGDALEVYFTGGDKTVLQGEDAEAFRKRSGLGGGMPNGAKAAVFWLVIVAAVVLVYMAVRARSGG
jgi:hypothetical protein